MEADLDIYRRGFSPEAIQWNDLYRALIIARSEKNLLEELKISDDDGKRMILESPNNCKSCASAFIKILSSFNKVLQLGNILVAFEELIEIHPPIISYLELEANTEHKSFFGMMLMLLHHENELLMYLSGYIISEIIVKDQCPIRKKDLVYYLRWIKNELKFCAGQHLTMLLRIMKTTLHMDFCRIPYYELEGVADLLSLLQEYEDFQIQYDTVFCIWLMSFNRELAENMHKYDIIEIFAKTLDNTSKLKVMRVIFATFTNLIKMSTQNTSAKYCIAMLKNNVLTRIKMLEMMKLSDEELLNDMSYIKEEVVKATFTMSSFEEFAYEVTSGNLKWGPVHTSSEFWRENVSKLNDNDCELLKLLLKWLDRSTDEEIISVACFDTGQYLEYYPEGKENIESLGGKQILMNLLSNENSTVQYEALHTIQKLLLNNWDNLGKLMEKQLGSATHRTPT